MAFGLEGDNSNGTSAAVSRCGVTAKRNGFVRIAVVGLLDVRKHSVRLEEKIRFPQRPRILIQYATTMGNLSHLDAEVLSSP